MPRSTRAKLSNVVKVRTAPSLLGGAGKSREELPRNRYIELGDIALGNSGRPMITQHGVPEPELVLPPVPEVPDAAVLTDVPRPQKRPKLELPRPVVRKPPTLVKSAPRSRPKLPAPPKAPRPALPKAPRPPKHTPPKPVSMARPKPKTGKPFAKARKH